MTRRAVVACLSGWLGVLSVGWWERAVRYLFMFLFIFLSRRTCSEQPAVWLPECIHRRSGTHTNLISYRTCLSHFLPYLFILCIVFVMHRTYIV